MKIQKRGLSFKLADFSFARGQRSLRHWVNRNVCPGSLKALERQEGRWGRHDRGPGRIINVPIGQVVGYGVCWIRGIIRQACFQILGIYKPYGNRLFPYHFHGECEPMFTCRL